MSEEKKTHPEHKYSVTFVSKVGTIIIFFAIVKLDKCTSDHFVAPVVITAKKGRHGEISNGRKTNELTDLQK